MKKSPLTKRIIAIILCVLMAASTMSILVYAFGVSARALTGNDLTVTMVTSNASTLYDADKVTLNAVIRNVGTQNVEEPFTVDFYLNGNLIQKVTCRAAVPVGGMKVVSTTKTAGLIFGNHKIIAVVNSDRKPEETDYENNRVKSRISVIDDLNPTPIPEPLPVEHDLIDMQPVAIFEAENTVLTGTLKKASALAGFKGTGYVENVAAEGDKMTFKYNAVVEGSYNIKVRYANSSNVKKSLSLYVNSDSAYSPVNFAAQAYSDAWSYETYTAYLKTGENTISLGFAKGNKSGIIVDRFEVERKISSSKVTSFRFEKKLNPSLPADINCKIENGNIHTYIANDIDISKLIATYETSYTSVQVKGVEQESGVTVNNFLNGHYYTFSDGNTSERYSVYLERLDNYTLPNLYIDLADSVTADEKNTLLWGWQAADKNLEAPCTVTLTVNSDTRLFDSDVPYNELNTLEESIATIRLRGNSTLGAIKKPYKIKLETKTPVLDMPKHKHWILLANYDDKSFMRYYLGFELGMICNNMGYTTRYRFVNFFFDGEYNGLYLLGEQIKADKNRVNITEMEKTSTNITGGYIIELDERRDEVADLLFEITYRGRKYPFTIKEPDEDVITPEMNTYIKNYVTDWLNTLENPETGKYEDYIDVDSFVDWYIASEIAKSNDSSGYSSIYLNKNADGKLCMGPLWDFNPGAGNVNYNLGGGVDKPEGYWIRDSIWWKRLFKDPNFEERVRARWQELYESDFKDFENVINDLEEYITPAANDNFKKWDSLSTYVWAQPKILHTYDAEVEFYRSWMADRIEWLNQQYGVNSPWPPVEDAK